MKKYMVIDVGGTAIKYALMDEEFNFYHKGELPTPKTGLEPYFNTLTELVMPYQSEISGVAFSMPGQIDSEKGYLFTGGNLDKFIHEYPVAEELKKRWGLPVTVENDARCAALAEVSKGALKGCKDGIVIVLGTGIGGAVIKNGKIHSGNKFSAGEVSFLLVHNDLEKRDCIWGEHGNNKAMLSKVSETTGIPTEELDGKIIFEMANQKDERVLEALRKHFREIAIQIYNLQVIYDPERIAIGGGISKQPLVIELIQAGLDEIYEKVWRTVNPVDLVPCHFRSDANLIGALYYHITKA